MLRTVAWIFCFLMANGAFAQLYPSTCEIDSVYDKKGILEYVFVNCDSVSYEYTFSEGKLISYTADYSQKVVHTKSNGGSITYSNLTLSFVQSFYPNGAVKEEYSKKYTSNGLFLSKWHRDTILSFYDTGILKERTVFGSNKTSQTSFYAENGRLKAVWNEDGEGKYSVKNYAPNKELLPNGTFNTEGTGLLNHYTDEGILDGQCYYRKGKLILKKCIVLE